jgi:hypothetical protein
VKEKTGESGGAQAANRRGRAASGPVGIGWVRKGEEEARQWRHRALTGGAGRHSAGRFGFKPIQTESKIFQTDSKFYKL